ncbi:L,D-transpeptidase [Bradyrhizobium sp. 2TAF24]|uniref:L,D-transpeptidase n=1 Tax=Bradyrhizobium sp. 2TAF24 TaxID=3233011 RepID=UPI003F8DF344
MFKTVSVVFAGACALGAAASPACAQSAAEPYVVYNRSAPPVRVASNDMGGGFIQFLFGGGGAGPAPGYPAGTYEPAPRYELTPRGRRMAPMPEEEMEQQGYLPRQQAVVPAQQGFDPKYEKQMVSYDGRERAGTIVIDTPNKFLYLVQADGRALRYGIGVGKPGFTWSGTKTISAKREWPDWTPPAEMLKRRPDLPRHMAGGPENPLGARAMYLGSSLYRIHGSNEPWTIGTNVSSGCIRMRNEDVIDLYNRVNVGARVIVI